MQHDGVGRRERADVFFAVAEEIDLAQSLPASVKPEIQAKLVVSGRGVGRGDSQSIRLDRVVELRSIAADDQAVLRRLRCGVCFEGRGACPPLVHQIKGGIDFPWAKEFSVGERVVNGLPEYLDVGQERLHAGRSISPEGLEFLPQGVEFLFECGSLFGRNGNLGVEYVLDF